ncbi:MAG: BTAD domain-containing putative transcriptional regulator [Caldilineales bacterium]
MNGVRLFVLGPPHLERNKETIDLRRQSLTLLGYLAVSGERHHRDRLAGLFWPDADPKRAYANLRHLLWELNKALGDGILDADRETVAVAAEAGLWTDLHAFRDLLAATRAHGHAENAVCPRCIAPLSDAVALARGRLLEGAAVAGSAEFDDWLYFAADEQRVELQSALRRLVAIYARKRDLSGAIEAGRRWLQLDPLDEEAHRQAMLVYALAGQRNAALRQYEECKRILDEELGVAPDARTQALMENIRRGALQEMAAERDAVVVLTETAEQPGRQTPAPTRARRRNLPAQVSPFVGRDAELADLTRLLETPDVRLVTILGVGGMGKTQLAVALAADAECHFEHGVCFVALAAVSSDEAIMSAVSDAFELPAQEGVDLAQVVGDYLAGKEILLVLDNAEHLAGAASAVSALLAMGAGIKIVVTSRQPLHLQNETIYALSGLGLAASGSEEGIAISDAARLFVQCARRFQPGFRLSAEDAHQVARICQAVDGMPLGILLAAGWIELLSPREIADEIERSIDLLATELKDIPDRQRSLRTVLSQTWEMLSRREQQILMALSLCRGGFDRDAAGEIAGASLRDLLGLANKSLVQRKAVGRFDMHELLRQFAGEMLAAGQAASEAARRAYGDWYGTRAAQWGQALTGPDQQRAVQLFRADLANIEAALKWAADHGLSDWLKEACEGVGIYYFQYYEHFERADALFRSVCERLDRVWSTPSMHEKDLLAYALAWQAFFHARYTRQSDLDDMLRRCHDLLPAPDQDTPETTFTRAFVYLAEADTPLDVRTREPYYYQSLVLFRQVGADWWSAMVLFELAINNWAIDAPTSERAFRECLAITERLGDQSGMADCTLALARLAAFRDGDIDRATGLFARSAVINRQLGDHVSLSKALQADEELALIQGRFPDLVELRERRLAMAEDLGSTYGIGLCQMLLSEAYHMVGRYQDALAMGERAAATQEKRIEHHGRGWLSWIVGLALLAVERPSEALHKFENSLESFRAISAESWYASSYLGLARASLELGNAATARSYHCQTLDWLLRHPNPYWLAYCFGNEALRRLEAGDPAGAVEIYARAEAFPFVANSIWFTDVYGARVGEAARSLPDADADAARSRGAALDLWETAPSPPPARLRAKVEPGLDPWEAMWAPYDEATYAFVLSHIRPDDVVLDIGAGDLRLARRMAAVARQVIAWESQAELFTGSNVPGNLTVKCADARVEPAPEGVTAAVLLMRHCTHYALYVKKLRAAGCRQLITNARWGMGVEVVDLVPGAPFSALAVGWYACRRCGAVGFAGDDPSAVTPERFDQTADVEGCPRCPVG